MEQEITYHTCSKCGEEKPLTSEYFVRQKINKTGFMISCCKVCNKQRCKKYNQENRGKNYEYQKKYYDENPEKLRLRKEYLKNYRKNHLKESNERHIKRLETETLYKITIHLRKIISTNIKKKSWGKKTKTQDYLKCDWETFKKHIENQFVDGMSWDNQGEWHYDHYYPVSLAQTEEDMYIFNHYTNFQPLWAEDNFSKSNKVPDGFEEWYEMMKEKIYGDTDN